MQSPTYETSLKTNNIMKKKMFLLTSNDLLYCVYEKVSLSGKEILKQSTTSTEYTIMIEKGLRGCIISFKKTAHHNVLVGLD